MGTAVLGTTEALATENMDHTPILSGETVAGIPKEYLDLNYKERYGQSLPDSFTCSEGSHTLQIDDRGNFRKICDPTRSQTCSYEVKVNSVSGIESPIYTFGVYNFDYKEADKVGKDKHPALHMKELVKTQLELYAESHAGQYPIIITQWDGEKLDIDNHHRPTLKTKTNRPNENIMRRNSAEAQIFQAGQRIRNQFKPFIETLTEKMQSELGLTAEEAKTQLSSERKKVSDYYSSLQTWCSETYGEKGYILDNVYFVGDYIYATYKVPGTEETPDTLIDLWLQQNYPREYHYLVSKKEYTRLITRKEVEEILSRRPDLKATLVDAGYLEANLIEP